MTVLYKWGSAVLSLRDSVHGVVRLGVRSLGTVGQVDVREVMRQAFVVGNRAMFFVCIVMLFTGAIMVKEASTQALRLIGDLTPIGPTYLQLLVREFGPTIVSLMVAARYGAGAAAELGAMKTSEQIDALTLAGAHIPCFLVLPRMLGGLLGTLPLIVLGTGVAFVSGGVLAHVAFDVGWQTYFSMRSVTPSDVVIGLTKALAFGLTIPMVASYAGLRARGGAPGVGAATTWAVVGASGAVLFLDLVIGAAGYLLEIAL